MRIDIWSDVICPWCFLGKRRFDAAVSRLGGLDGELAGKRAGVEVRWRAFQLDPTATSEPGDLEASIDRKYGPGSFDRMTHRLVTLGTEEGIDYRFDLAKRVNTVDAHRLVAWARAVGGADLQAAMVERLFVAYFEEGASVADHHTLARLAAEAGLDASATAEMLSGSDLVAEVERDVAQARERGVTGVPAFVVNDQFVIPGAQDTETFVSLLGRLAERAGTGGGGAPRG